MLRVVAAACVLSCLTTSAWAQGQPATPAAPSATAAKPSVKKPVSKARVSAKPSATADSGACQVGVISMIGDTFAVQKIGFTVFSNEYTDVPIEGWGIDDLVVARVRAALPKAAVRKIPYSKAALEPYEHPAPSLFRNPQAEFTAFVREITANAGCERYVAVIKLTTQVDGTNQAHRGIGLLNRGIGALTHTFLFTDISVSVLDGHTYAIRKEPINVGKILEKGLLGDFANDPLSKLDNDAFPEPASRAATSPLLRERTRALLTAILDKKLAVLFQEQ